MQGTRTTYRSVIKRNCELNAVREIDTFYRRKFRVYSIPRDSREIFSVRFSSKFQEYQDSVKFKIFDSSTWKSNIETSLIHEQVKRASMYVLGGFSIENVEVRRKIRIFEARVWSKLIFI